MKKSIFLIAVTLLVIGLTGTSYALIDTTLFSATGTTPPEDYNSHNTWWGPNVQWLSGLLDYVCWTHHFTVPCQDITCGVLSLTLYDDDPADNKWWKYELGFGWGEDFSWDFGEVDPGIYSYSVNGDYLEDGTYSVFLKSLGGGFGICQSDLEIICKTPPAPEPATMSLLGLGILGLAGFRKKVVGGRS